jgi:hypothetical protein
MNSFIERCWFIYGFRLGNLFLGIIIKHSQGEIANVKFNWEKIYDSKYLLGFFHTHPDGMLGYSDTDYRTMRAWVSCMGQDLICGIWNEQRNLNACYLFKNNKTISKIKCVVSGLIFIGRTI